MNALILIAWGILIGFYCYRHYRTLARYKKELLALQHDLRISEANADCLAKQLHADKTKPVPGVYLLPPKEQHYHWSD